jgi:hypothetical protein
VPYQNEEICLFAVIDNGLALEFVENQNDEICLKAVEQNGLAIKYVKKINQSICDKAINSIRHSAKDDINIPW